MKASKSFKTAKTETFREEKLPRDTKAAEGLFGEKEPKVSLLTTRLTKEVQVTLTAQEELEIIQKWARSYPQVLKIILDAKDKRICCPFALQCNQFPCSNLSCNADCCCNGYAYRMS